MRLRIRKRIRLGPGFSLNLNKGSISLTSGGRGFHSTIGTRGVSSTIGLPGTGISYTSSRSWRGRRRRGASEDGAKVGLFCFFVLWFFSFCWLDGILDGQWQLWIAFAIACILVAIPPALVGAWREIRDERNAAAAAAAALAEENAKQQVTPQKVSRARDDTMPCPACAETIKRAAHICRFCHTLLTISPDVPPHHPVHTKKITMMT
jgi:hypothetical protein